MTLPFRRRHHDDEASHDRAHALISASLLGPLSDADGAWLGAHLERCPECTADRAGYDADRALLQALRETPPTPPRDLWARTSAAIDREAAAHARHGLFDRALGPRPGGIPLGPLAGVLVAAVVLVVALLPPGTPIVPGRTGNPPSGIAFATPHETPISIDNQVAWLQRAPDGSYSIVFGAVDQVCAAPGSKECAIDPGSPAPIAIAAPPQAVVLSPTSNQVAVVPSGDQPDGDVVIVTVSTPAPSEPAGGSAPPSASATSVPPTLAPTGLPASPAPTSQPGESAGASAPPSSGPNPNSHAIIHGVVVVGAPGYSVDGQWFAFSARPKDGLRGPDLYVWHVGDDAARQLTDNGLTYFAGWFGDQIVASTVTLGSGAMTFPGASAVPTTDVTPSDVPTGSAAAASPSASGSPVAPVVELHPVSFLLDPATLVRTDFARPDVWLPAIDPHGHFVVYWSGTVTPDGDAAAAAAPRSSPDPAATADPEASASPGVIAIGAIRALRPATGHLVLDGWSAPFVVPPSPEPTAAAGTSGAPGGPSEAPSTGADATAAPASPPADLGSPDPSAPLLAEGPAGTTLTLADGPVTDFDVRFDPTGTRLAVWTADSGDPTLGPLRLVLLDPVALTIDPAAQPLATPGVVALRGFSIDEGRLGWVTPPGQNGQPSSVQVLAWKDDAFGQILTVPGGNPQIVR